MVEPIQLKTLTLYKPVPIQLQLLYQKPESFIYHGAFCNISVKARQKVFRTAVFGHGHCIVSSRICQPCDNSCGISASIDNNINNKEEILQRKNTPQTTCICIAIAIQACLCHHHHFYDANSFHPGHAVFVCQYFSVETHSRWKKGPPQSPLGGYLSGKKLGQRRMLLQSLSRWLVGSGFSQLCRQQRICIVSGKNQNRNPVWRL